MAIEAAKQVTDPNVKVSGLKLKNVIFMSALVLPADTVGVDTRFIMTPQHDEGPENGGWYEFSLFSDNGSWIKHCTGKIQAVIDKDGRVEEHSTDTLGQFDKAVKQCTTALEPSLFYESLQTSGLQFGPSFAPILNISTDQVNHLVTKIKTYTIDSAINWNETYTIHPTTLDGLMQSTQLLRSQGGQKSIPPSIPSRLDKAWFSCAGLSSPDAQSIKVGTQLTHEGRKESAFNLTAVNEDEKEALINIEGITFSAIDSNQDTQGFENLPGNSSTCHQIEWKPDVYLMTQVELMQFLKKKVNLDSRKGVFLDHTILELLVEGFIARAVNAFNQNQNENENMAAVPAHMPFYVEWLKLRLQKGQRGESPFSSQYWQSQIQDDASFESLCSTVEGDSQQGKMLVNVGKALLKYAHAADYRQPLSSIVDLELVEASGQEVVSLQLELALSQLKLSIVRSFTWHSAVKRIH